MSLNESHVEDAALEWFEELGYAVGHGPQLVPGEPAAERESFGAVVQLKQAGRKRQRATGKRGVTEKPGKWTWGEPT
jgi:hypothetical protein